MKALVPVLTVLCLFIVTGGSLRCMECVNSKGGSCKGKSYKCSTRATSCLQTLAITRIGDEIHKSTLKSCNDDNHLCDRDFVVNSGHRNKQVRIVTKCCRTNNCNRCKIKLPPYNATGNGLICPVCYNYNSYDCVHRSYMLCRGLQEYCIDWATTMYKEDFGDFKFSLMGCTTEGSCSLAPKIVPGVKIVDAERTSCSKAAPITL